MFTFVIHTHRYMVKHYLRSAKFLAILECAEKTHRIEVSFKEIFDVYMHPALRPSDEASAANVSRTTTLEDLQADDDRLVIPLEDIIDKNKTSKYSNKSNSTNSENLLSKALETKGSLSVVDPSSNNNTVKVDSSAQTELVL